MTVSDFADFYWCVHKNPPFPWQRRLLERVVNEGWPETISLPTSSGKTSAIDVAVFHLALEAGKNGLQRRAPLRVFFVIDRRVVVDEAAEHALQLAQALTSPKDGNVRAVSDALLSFGARHALDVAVLRGGMYRDNTWADEPNQPLVCVSTVDQVGSRLLFRGYQVSERAKSVHAGLVGNDSLIIVDEAHLSTPFLDTLAFIEGVQQQERAGKSKLIRGLEVVRMSATVESADGAFRLEESDYDSLVLRKRLAASKPAELRSPAKGFEGELVRAAEELAALPGVSITGIVVNTVAVARSVFEELRKSRDSEAILLTGRSRPHDAKKLWEEYKDKISAKPNRISQGRLFVVATQTVEVGANLDFDALVTESAPLDALRQRFGRLNRLGNRSEAQAIVIRRPKEDPVYGERTAKTWDLLLELEKVDFGVMAMDEASEGRPVIEFITERPKGPLVFSKYLEMWAQTNPVPDPDPDIAPFLHGRDALDAADVQVVWRSDLLEDSSGQAWQKDVEAAPPVSSEALALPLGVVRRWLRGETKLNVADVEGAGREEDVAKENRRTPKAVLIWRGDDKSEFTTDIGRIRLGDVVVVPASYGGCDQFGWHPESREPVKDIGDEANNEMADKGLRNYRLRLTAYANGLETDKREYFQGLLQSLEQARGEGEDDADIRDQIARMLRPSQGNWRIHSDGRLATAPKPKQKKDEIEPSLKPEDQDDSVGLERRITLERHTGGVVDHVRKYASSCGLPSELVEDLVLTARFHDLGKCDDRFQELLWQCSKSPAHAMTLSEPLAKSDGDLTPPERRRAQKQASYPQGARHESASVLLACASDSLGRAHDRDLVLHLIGTHHGYGRPLLPFWEEEEGVTVNARFDGKDLEAGTGRELGRFDSGWSEQFSRLNEKYGYWGLAYLETVLRRGDVMQSREEQEP